MLCILFPFSLLVDCNWLDLDKVSLKLASKNLVRSKLKPHFEIFSVSFYLKKRISIIYGLLQAENIRSARSTRILLSKLLAARKANFLSLLVLAKKLQCSHARECSQRPFVTPKKLQLRFIQ